MSFGNTFDSYLIIHAPFVSPERRPIFENNLKSVGVKEFSVVEASQIKNDDPRLKFYENKAALSLIDAFDKCICLAKKEKWQNVIIFEDDIIFRRKFQIWWEEIEDEVKQYNWDILYLYRWNIELIREPRAKTNLLPIKHTFCSHCFAVRENAYSAFQEALNYAMQKNKTADSPEVHEYLNKNKFKVLATSRNLAGQAGSVKSVISSFTREATMADMFRIRVPVLARAEHFLLKLFLI
jgi:hypothetical protein